MSNYCWICDIEKLLRGRMQTRCLTAWKLFGRPLLHLPSTGQSKARTWTMVECHRTSRHVPNLLSLPQGSRKTDLQSARGLAWGSSSGKWCSSAQHGSHSNPWGSNVGYSWWHSRMTLFFWHIAWYRCCIVKKQQHPPHPLRDHPRPFPLGVPGLSFSQV